MAVVTSSENPRAKDYLLYTYQAVRHITQAAALICVRGLWTVIVPVFEFGYTDVTGDSKAQTKEGTNERSHCPTHWSLKQEIQVLARDQPTGCTSAPI